MTATLRQPISLSEHPYDIDAVRRDFPILAEMMHGKPLVYLDNAATTQKPQSVIDALVRYYTRENSNIHRGVHLLSERATRAYEGAREKVQRFLNAPLFCEIIFLRGATEGINLVVNSYGRRHVGPGDEVVISAIEHHSNIVPWQMLCEEKGAVLRVIPVDDRGDLILEEYERLLSPKTKFVSLVHISNALGTVNPVKQMIEMAHAHGAPVLLDGAQAAPHMVVDVQDLDVDFYVFSGHKMYGPTGVGALYGKASVLKDMPPWQGGGDMIRSVTFEKTIYNDLPHRFEAGTPNIAGGIALGTAIDYVTAIGLDKIAAHEADLLEYGTGLLSEIPQVRIIGEARQKAGVISFVVQGAHPHDVGTILDHEGVAVRTGHHCAQPVMERYGIPATARASLGLYNTRGELDTLAAGIHKVLQVFGS